MHQESWCFTFVGLKRKQCAKRTEWCTDLLDGVSLLRPIGPLSLVWWPQIVLFPLMIAKHLLFSFTSRTHGWCMKDANGVRFSEIEIWQVPTRSIACILSPYSHKMWHWDNCILTRRGFDIWGCRFVGDEISFCKPQKIIRGCNCLDLCARQWISKKFGVKRKVRKEQCRQRPSTTSTSVEVEDLFHTA